MPRTGMHLRTSAALLICLLLPAGRTLATAGLAETSWYFHDRPGQWIEWNHGDICPPQAPSKECLFTRRSKAADFPSDSPRPEPVPYARPPRGLYWNTIRPMLPLAAAWLGLGCLWRRWRERAAAPGRWNAPSSWALGLVTAVALAWVPHAAAVLFPASPTADGWIIVVGLCMNLLIVLAPPTLWWAYRALFPPPGRALPGPWARRLLWPTLLSSSLLAPLLVWGPPHVLMLVFPPMMLPNILVSLLAVAALSAATDALTRRRAGTKPEPGGARP